VIDPLWEEVNDAELQTTGQQKYETQDPRPGRFWNGKPPCGRTDSKGVLNRQTISRWPHGPPAGDNGR
jgi:hypothetical protein